jgi:hypothetical protein
MTEENNTPESEAIKSNAGSHYVAFCDILGFSNRILTDFDRTLHIYKEFGELVSGFKFKDVQVTLYSDAILLTSISLARILSAVQELWFFALVNDLMIRGAITKGRYWEQRQNGNFLVASDALVRAVKLEPSVGVPAVVVADDVEIPDDYWLSRFVRGLFATPVLHFRDRNIVNPFNTYWFRSAASRAAQLMDRSPAHKDKYLWFLALHEAVASGRELIPPDVLARFLQQGKLTKTTNAVEKMELPERNSLPTK